MREWNHKLAKLTAGSGQTQADRMLTWTSPGLVCTEADNGREGLILTSPPHHTHLFVKSGCKWPSLLSSNQKS